MLDAPSLSNIFKICHKLIILCDSHKMMSFSSPDYRIFVVKDDHTFRQFFDCSYTPLVSDCVENLESFLIDGRIRHYQMPRYKQIHFLGKELTTDGGLEVATVDEKYVFDEKTLVLNPLQMYYSAILQREVDLQNGKQPDENNELFVFGVQTR